MFVHKSTPNSRPRLSADGRRKLQLQLDAVDLELGFAGGAHWWWLNSDAMQKKSLEAQIEPVEDAREPVFRYRLTGALIHNDSEFVEVRRYHEGIFRTQAGLDRTVELLIRTFDTIAGPYFFLCEGSPERYRNFAARLNAFKQQAIRRCRAKWRGREDDWFDRIVLPRAADQLEGAALVWRQKARTHEEQILDFTEERPVKAVTPPLALPADPVQQATVSDAPPPPASAVSAEPAQPATVSAGMCFDPDFHKWLRDQIKDLGITAINQIAKAGGPRPETIESVLNGSRYRVSTERKIRNAITRLRADIADEKHEKYEIRNS
jgi:hypothetical protein